MSRLPVCEEFLNGMTAYEMSDYQEAIKHFKKGHLLRKVGCTVALGRIMYEGDADIIVGSKNIGILLFEVAKENNAVKMLEMYTSRSPDHISMHYGYLLAFLHDEGLCGLPQDSDMEICMPLYEEAARKGQASAMNDIGWALFTRPSATTEFPGVNGSGFRCYEMAFEMGNSVAATNIADCYLNGDGVDSDLNQAVYYIDWEMANGRKSKAANFLYARFATTPGVLTAGQTEPDYGVECHYLHCGHLEGDSEASGQLAEVFADGSSVVARNALRSTYLLLIAADGGDDVALGDLQSEEFAPYLGAARARFQREVREAVTRLDFEINPYK